MTATATSGNFTRVIRPGVILQGAAKVSVFCKIEYTDGKLSISGVEGPKRNGDAVGSCGQIVMGYAHRDPAKNDARYSTPTTINEFAPGWDAEKWLNFVDAWDAWHLNDMRPQCQHQTGAAWNASRKITLYYFRLSEAEKRARGCVASGETFTPTAKETKLAKLPDRVTWHESHLPAGTDGYYVPNFPQYTNDHYNKPSEEKTAGWVTEREHPLGILSKPCPICGYKYGSEWRREEVPAKVLEFLKSLPLADAAPAWV